MRIPKRYGDSKFEACPFCGKQATTQNSQKMTVCQEHKNAILNEMYCACGKYLELKSGKYGFFFLCEKCGCLNSKKVFSMNEIKDVSYLLKDDGKQISRSDKNKEIMSLLNKVKPKDVSMSKTQQKVATKYAKENRVTNFQKSFRDSQPKDKVPVYDEGFIIDMPDEFRESTVQDQNTDIPSIFDIEDLNKSETLKNKDAKKDDEAEEFIISIDDL